MPLAIPDSRIISKATYSLMNYGTSTNDNEPRAVRPVLLYSIDNKDQLSVTVNLQSGTVKVVVPSFNPLLRICNSPGLIASCYATKSEDNYFHFRI